MPLSTSKVLVQPSPTLTSPRLQNRLQNSHVRRFAQWRPGAGIVIEGPGSTGLGSVVWHALLDLILHAAQHRSEAAALRRAS